MVRLPWTGLEVERSLEAVFWRTELRPAADFWSSLPWGSSLVTRLLILSEMKFRIIAILMIDT